MSWEFGKFSATDCGAVASARAVLKGTVRGGALGRGGCMLHISRIYFIMQHLVFTTCNQQPAAAAATVVASVVVVVVFVLRL